MALPLVTGYFVVVVVHYHVFLTSNSNVNFPRENRTIKTTQLVKASNLASLLLI
jgi:hypothetical protein